MCGSQTTVVRRGPDLAGVLTQHEWCLALEALWTAGLVFAIWQGDAHQISTGNIKACVHGRFSDGQLIIHCCCPDAGSYHKPIVFELL